MPDPRSQFSGRRGSVGGQFRKNSESTLLSAGGSPRKEKTAPTKPAAGKPPETRTRSIRTSTAAPSSMEKVLNAIRRVTSSSSVTESTSLSSVGLTANDGFDQLIRELEGHFPTLQISPRELSRQLTLSGGDTALHLHDLLIAEYSVGGTPREDSPNVGRRRGSAGGLRRGKSQ